MTSLLDRAPDLDPLLGSVREVNLLVDRMLTAVDDDLAPAACAGMVTGLERLGRRVDALRLKVVARGETAAAARGAGFPDTGSWLARQSRRSRPDAAKQAQLADDLGAAPATGEAMARGALSAEHAAVITAALAKLPAGVTAEQRAAVEAELVAKADRFDPAQLRRVARRALEAIEPDPAVVDAAEDEQIRDEEEQAHAKARFTFHVNDDGTVTGHFTVGELEFSYLRKILDAMTAPRRQGARTPGGSGTTDGTR